MQTKKKLILLSALTFGLTYSAFAQDVIVDFKKEARFTGLEENIAKNEDVTFKFVGAANKNGVYIGSDYWASVYYLTVSAPRSIAVIEYEVEISSGKTDDVTVSIGNVNKLSDGTRVWKGSAQTIKFTGGSSSAEFRITRLRLWFDEKDYNHDTAIWEEKGEGGNDGDARPFQENVDFTNDTTDYTMTDRLYASVNILPTDGRGVPMAVVSDRKFENTLKTYLDWKTQQGYQVQELYTDKLPSGLTNYEKALAIREQLMAMDPRPAYVLLVGDVQEIPSFTTSPSIGPADLFYGEFTDDYYPDAYVGRFSARTTTELEPQLQKTRYMAGLHPKDGEWLKRSLTVNSISNDIAVMTPAAKLARYYPLNFDGNTSQELTASSTESINTYINNGCSLVSYFGHGGPGQWASGYQTTNVSGLNNANMYPVVLSITCYTGHFGWDRTSLAETFMQRPNAGAVAVIASSRESLSDYNYRRFYGDDKGGIGLLRSLFPSVGTDPSQRARTIGQALEISTLPVAKNLTENFCSHTEMYNLLGDPTYQPYITTPKANKLHASSNIISTGRNVTVNTVPYAMVALSQERTVITAAVADADGKVTLHVPAKAPVGQCTLYTSAPGYHDLSSTVTLTAGNGTEESLADAQKPATVTHTDVISLETAGDAVGANWWNGQKSIGSTISGAKYRICAVNDQSPDIDNVVGYKRWLNPNASAEGIYMRNRYDQSGIVTTTSGGNARTVSVDWLHPTGLGEVIGVYGSNTPYNSTEQAWKGGEGKKLGELVKGQNNTLNIEGDYAYLLFRAEPSREHGNESRLDVFFKSLTIGWEKALQKCAAPKITFEDGQILLSCTTNGATYNCGVAPAQAEGKFVITATAEAEGYKTSDPATLTIDASQLAKMPGDIDDNGVLSVADIVKLINSIIPQKK